MTRVQGGCVVLLHALIHTQMARLGVTDLKLKIISQLLSLSLGTMR